MQLKKKINSENGFTLVELILYVALVAIVIGGIVTFAWSIIYGGIKANVQLDVNQTGRFVAKRIAYEIQNSSAINSVQPTDLCLASLDTSRNPTRINVSGNVLNISWGGGSLDCTNMTNTKTLVASNLAVSDLLFTNNSLEGVTQNINYTFTLSSTATRQEWQYESVFTNTVEVRVGQ